MNFWLGVILLFMGAYYIGRLSLSKQITALVETCYILVEAINKTDSETEDQLEMSLVGLYPYITYKDKPIISYNSKGDLNV